MERLIPGTDIKNSAEASGRCGFCEFFVYVKKGHEECGDSAFVFCDEKKAIIGIFDGVSGEEAAASASSEAAGATLAYLKKSDSCDEKRMKEAFSLAQHKIQRGYTTALVFFVKSDGSFVIASAGDSPAYGLDEKGGLEPELPLGRAVKDGDGIFKYLHFRNIVTSVLGPGGGEAEAHMRSGKLDKNEIFILASDGLSDNLWLKTSEGFVTGSSGSDDLKKLIGTERSPEKIAKKLAGEIDRRVKAGRKELKNALLVPKEDDLSLAVIRFIK